MSTSYITTSGSGCRRGPGCFDQSIHRPDPPLDMASPSSAASPQPPRLLLGFERLNFLVRQSPEKGLRVLGLPLSLVVHDELEDLLTLVVVDAGIRLVHHAFDIALPLRARHSRIDRPGNGMAFGAFSREHFVALLHLRRVSRHVNLVRPPVLRQIYAAGVLRLNQATSARQA